MNRRTALVLALLLCGGGAGLLGCSPSTELDGAPVPNSRPDTRISGQPPTIIEASFVVSFFWTGSDPDGQVTGFQWRISDNGTDGISYRDTLTFDPATGDTLNPWHTTTVTDSTFIVTADIPEFPGDPEDYARSYETHTIWVRAVDDRGAVDPTPAFISFTATTLLPSVFVDTPSSFGGQSFALAAPPAVTFGWTGVDPDWDAGTPTAARYLFKQALLSDGSFCTTKTAFDENVDFLLSYEDSAWSPWIAYEVDAVRRRAIFPDTPQRDPDGNLIYYLFAVQVRDTAGAVSVDRTYGRSVANCYTTRTLTPILRVYEPFLGSQNASGVLRVDRYDIAKGQPLNFNWSATAASYAGEVVSYRYGWDVGDPDDPEDPNWAIAPGLTDQHKAAPTQVYESGVHVLTIVVMDNSNQRTLYRIVLNVVPVPDPANQRPLLLVDDVQDRDASGWPSQDGAIRYNNDINRDAFWESVLDAASGGVQEFLPSEDIWDSEDRLLDYRTVVNYRALFWMVRYTNASNNTVGAKFRPESPNKDKFIWLAPYQEQVGNLFYMGARGLNHFLFPQNYMVPMVFEARERYLILNNVTYVLGWGERELPDGTMLRVGLDRYPYRVIGISVLDQMSPPQYNIYGRPSYGFQERTNICASMKALVLDEDFRDTYLAGSGAIADTIWTEPRIDWQGRNPTASPGPNYWFELPYVWSIDEFYNQDIANRGTPFTIQDCEVAGSAEPVPCIVPMFRALSRYDWYRLKLAEAGDPEWPRPTYNTDDLNEACGEMCLNGDQTSSRTNGTMVGFITLKNSQTTPSGRGDVVWGFDIYRFDWQEAARAVRWVIGEHFGIPLRP
jgi:hypothetical protein